MAFRSSPDDVSSLLDLPIVSNLQGGASSKMQCINGCLVLNFYLVSADFHNYAPVSHSFVKGLAWEIIILPVFVGRPMLLLPFRRINISITDANNIFLGVMLFGFVVGFVNIPVKVIPFQVAVIFILPVSFGFDVGVLTFVEWSADDKFEVLKWL